MMEHEKLIDFAAANKKLEKMAVNQDMSLAEMFSMAASENTGDASLGIRMVCDALKKTTRLFAITFASELPYFDMDNDVEKTLEKPVLPVFLSGEEAQEAISTMVPPVVRETCVVRSLGVGHGIDAITDIWHFGARKLRLGNVTLDTDALTYSVRKKGISCFALAPDVLSALSIMMQCIMLNRNEDADLARTYAAVAAPQGYIGVALRKKDVKADIFCPLTNQDAGIEIESPCILTYTDGFSFMQDFRLNKEIDIGITTWDMLVAENKPININGLINISAESALELQQFSLRGRMAQALISANLGISSTARTEAVFRDIQASRKLALEFFSGLEYDKENDTVSFAFPNTDMVVVDGMNAKQLFELGICATPSAAYHVLALLEQEKDPEGPMHTSFNNGTLFD